MGIRAETVPADIGRDRQARADSPAEGASAPLWFERALIVICAAVLSWGGGGLLLAHIGDYSFALAATLGLIGTACGCLIALSHHAAPAAAGRSSRSARSSSLAAVGMCLAAIGFALWNGAYAGHHVQINRDPGVYAVTGKWIALHGNVIVHLDPTWLGSIPGLNLASAGMYPEPGNTLQFQFPHFFPALLAEADNLGGDGLMFRMNSLLGAIGLCAVFATGCRLVRRPWLVLAAIVGLGLCMPELNGVRDTFSEPSTQVLLWFGVWLTLLALGRRAGWRTLGLPLLAGAALGGTLMTRIDAVAYLIMVPPLAAFGWLAATRARRGPLLATYAAMLVGGVPAAVLGTLDVQRRAGRYYHDLHHNVTMLYLACLASLIASAVLVAAWSLLPRLRALAATWRGRVAVAAGWVCGLGLLAAWALRPALQTARYSDVVTTVPEQRLNELLQKRAGVPVDPLRTYAEHSLVWFSWYLGPVAVGLAVVGAALLTIQVIRRSPAAATVVLAIPGALTAAYLWNPHVNGDQVWAMRRFLPASLPLCALLAAVGLAAVSDAGGRLLGNAAYRRGASVAGAAALVAFPFGATWNVREASPEAGYAAAVDGVCAQVGKNAAIAITPVGSTGGAYTQTLRTWCGVPVARLPADVTEAQVRTLADRWRSAGRTLWIVGGTGQSVAKLVPPGPSLPLAAAASPHEIEMTLVRAPDGYQRPSAVTFWGAKATG